MTVYHSDSGLDSCTRSNTDDSGLIYSSIYINDQKSVTLCEVLLFSEYVIDFIVPMN